MNGIAYECRLLNIGFPPSVKCKNILFIKEKLRVSSVLNKDVKTFGKKCLFDNNDETCWSSDQGSPQWIEVVFDREKTISSLLLQFQGGFVGEECVLEMKKSDNTVLEHPFYPEDNNTLQAFELNKVCVKSVRLVFKKSTDFFGRIVVYNLHFN